MEYIGNIRKMETFPGKVIQYFLPLGDQKIFCSGLLLSMFYPVIQYQEKIKSLNFDKDPVVSGVLTGIKGQNLPAQVFPVGFIHFCTNQLNNPACKNGTHLTTSFRRQAFHMTENETGSIEIPGTCCIYGFRGSDTHPDHAFLTNTVQISLFNIKYNPIKIFIYITALK